MKKRVWIWIITVSVMLAVIAVTLLLPGQDGLLIGKAKVDDLADGQAITIDTKAENFGILRGDLFYYYVDVIYNPQLVSEIDEDNLLLVINLEPFEIRDTEIEHFKLDSNKRLLRIQYQLQLIDGKTDSIYEFPSIVVRYKPVNTEGYMEYPSPAEPVYITSRLPDDIQNILQLMSIDLDLGYSMLRPVNGEVVSTEQSRLPYIFVIAGVFLAVGVLSDYFLRIVPQRRREKEKNISEKNTLISNACASLYKNLKDGAATEDILYQADHIIRLVLFQKENLDWLEDLRNQTISPGIKDTVFAFFKNTQNPVEDDQTEKCITETLEYMEKILKFYYPEEAEGWKK
jgi:hypothetical protein